MKVLFRADGNESIGLGHVIRSLALAEMLKENFDCVFAIQNPSDSLLETIREVCSEIIILPNLNDEAELDQFLDGSEIVVLDGYKFNTEYQLHIKSKGCQLVCIDDIHAYHFVADVIVNHGINDASFYSNESYTKLLLGTAYALLRKPFLALPSNRNFSVENKNVFLCFGGADLHNLTLVYLQRLLKIKNISTIHVVTGSAYQEKQILQQVIAEHKYTEVKLHSNINAAQLFEVICNCHIAVVPGSTIAIECASTGIPMLVGHYVDNQRDVVKMLSECGLAKSVGDFNELNEAAFIENMESLVKTNRGNFGLPSKFFFDGKIRMRFAKAFTDLHLSSNLVLRKAVESDAELFFQWANDPAVRSNAINQEYITFESHLRWFHTKITSLTSFIYVAELEGKNLGQIRFDAQGRDFVISYSVCLEFRGKGYAATMLDKAIKRLYNDLSQQGKLIALVKNTNIASLKVFENLKFSIAGNKVIGADTYNVFEKTF